MKKKQETCPRCINDVALAFYFEICRQHLSSKLDCKKLSGQYLRGEITVDQVAKKVREAATNDPELVNELDEIERIRKTGKL